MYIRFLDIMLPHTYWIKIECGHKFYIHGKKRICMTCFIAIITLLQWSETEPAIFLKSAWGTFVISLCSL